MMRKTVLLCVLWAFLAGTSASALDDFRTRIAVLPMQNATQEARYNSICQTVTETVALVFRLMGKYNVVESDEDPGLLNVDTSTTDTLAAFAEASKYDEVLVGLASKDDTGTLTFRLSLFSRKEGKIKYDSSSTAGSILEVFDAADEITVGLLSQVSDIHIGFGAIEVKAASGKGAYAVFLNDAKIRNPKTMLGKVLNGTYTLSIHQNRLLGDTEIYRQEIKVFEDETTTVSFPIPAATPEETAFIEAQKQKLLTAPADQIETLLTDIATFQQKSQGIDYDDTLKAAQAQTLAAAGARAMDMLKTATAAADGKFYAKNPDFKTARESYEQLTRMISNPFDYQMLDKGAQSPFTSPSEIQVAPDGTIFILDSAVKIRIGSSSDGKTLTGAMSLDNAQPTNTNGHVAFDASSRGYYIHPDLSEIMELDKNLQKIKTIPVPGLQPDPQTILRVAVSEEGEIYLLGGSQVIVFEPGGQRESEIEKSLQAGLQQNSVAAVDGVFIDRQGLLNVLDDAGGKVLRFDASGAFQSAVDLPGIDSGSQAAVDALGYFYVTIPEEHRIAKYSPQGELISSFGSYGTGPGQFSSPQGIAIGPDGKIYVADTYNNRVQILVPTAAPILLADVARYGMTLSQRETTAEKAQNRMSIALGNIHARDVAIPLAEGAGFLAAGVGLIIAGSYFDVTAQSTYQQYSLATDPAQVSALHDATAQNWIISAFSSLGSDLTLVGAAALLTSALVTGAKNATVQSDTISQIQAFDMDSEYELDRSRYRSLSAAENIGFWVGVLPPLLGAGTLFTLEEVPLDTGYLAQIVAGASVLIPPFLSNVYAGRLDTGLLTSSLIADALVAVSAALYLVGAPNWTPVDLGSSLSSALPDIYPYLNSAWKSIQTKIALYPLIAALGIRLAAGAFDMKTGWIEAKNTNLYRAIKKKGPAPEVSVEVLPDGRPQVALTLRY
ncbi:MAG: NHL repeat-containing protein [Spirochaetia bacterium]|jgi:DNA-binding beta-propeller fold protein YncE